MRYKFYKSRQAGFTALAGRCRSMQLSDCTDSDAEDGGPQGAVKTLSMSEHVRTAAIRKCCSCMKRQYIYILYIYMHGKCSCRENATALDTQQLALALTRQPLAKGTETLCNKGQPIRQQRRNVERQPMRQSMTKERCRLDAGAAGRGVRAFTRNRRRRQFEAS